MGLQHPIPLLFPPCPFTSSSFLFYLFPFLIRFTHILFLSIPSLSIRIVPLRFQAGGCRRRLKIVSVLQCFQAKSGTKSLTLKSVMDRQTDRQPQPKATCTEKLVKFAHVIPEISWWTDRQIDTQTDMLITIFHHHSRRRSN